MGIMTLQKQTVRAAVVLSVVLFGGCATQNTAADLARNDLLYQDVPFQTKAPGDRTVFVAPLADDRAAQQLPTQERGFPIVYGDDQVWERPVGEMLSEVLHRQLQASGLFPSVVDTATPESLVVKPTMVSFVTGAAESMSGCRSFAEVGLRLQVFGPADASGTRALLLEETYGNRQASELGLNPMSPYRLVGRALHISVAKLLAGLDGSNVSRSQVPIVVAVPASVSPSAK